MRFKVNDSVRVVAAMALPDMVGKIYLVQYVGPWKKGDLQPNGGYALTDCDYILLDPEYQENTLYAPGISCRDNNLESA